MQQRLVQPGHVVGLRDVNELQGVRRLDDGGLEIRALTTHRQAERSTDVQAYCPALAETFARVATVRIRNQATVGGNVAHADPAQDPPPMLIALGGQAVVASRQGQHRIPLHEFFVDYFETALQPGEVLLAAELPPLASGTRVTYKKFLPRTQDDYATVSVAARLRLGQDQRCEDIRVALGAAATVPVRARKVADALRGQRLDPGAVRDAAALVRDEVDPLEDLRGSAGYKREMARVWTERVFWSSWRCRCASSDVFSALIPLTTKVHERSAVDSSAPDQGLVPILKLVCPLLDPMFECSTVDQARLSCMSLIREHYRGMLTEQQVDRLAENAWKHIVASARILKAGIDASAPHAWQAWVSSVLMVGSHARLEAVPGSDLDWNIILADGSPTRLDLPNFCMFFDNRDRNIQENLSFHAITGAAARIAPGTPRCRCFTTYELIYDFSVENRDSLGATILASSFPVDIPDSSRPVLRNLRQLILAAAESDEGRMGLARSRLCLLVGRLYRAPESTLKAVKAAHTVMSCLVQMLELLLSTYADLVSDSSPNGARRIRPYWFMAHEFSLNPETCQMIARLADQVSTARLSGDEVDYPGLTHSVSILIRTIIFELATTRLISGRQADAYLDILASSPANNEWCAGICG